MTSVQFNGVETVTNTVPQLAEIDVALLTGGFDRPYAFGLAMELASQRIRLDVIGSDEVDSPEFHETPRLSFLKLQDNPRDTVSSWVKISRIARYYARLVRYVASSRAEIFHILWNNKLQYFDRTVLMAYYKALGKKIVFTAHNVNAGKRDGNDSLLNRLTLQIQYRLADHIFVHTEKMKAELLEDFKVRGDAVTVIPFGINNSVPDTEMTPVEAKRRLGIGPTEKTILFFGAVRPYKGLEFLLAAFNKVMEKDPGYRLIVAGELKKGSETYSEEIRGAIATSPYRDRILDELKFIPDEETELYFKAADVSALPYTLVFQSGVLFLSYSFGLPAIASNVGSFAEDIVKGDTGFVCEPCDAEDLAKAIETYFESDLYQSLDGRRQTIRAFANAKHSWEVVGGMTRSVYAGLLGKVS